MRLRNIGVCVLTVALAVAGASCGSDKGSDPANDRGAVSFSEPPAGSTTLGLCSVFAIEQMKQAIGGEESFKRLAPVALGSEGDAVTGEACSWERFEDNGDTTILRIEARDYGSDPESLVKQFGELQSGTLGAEAIDGLGDAAFSSVSDTTSLVQIRSDQYLVTLASRSSGSLEPVSLDALILFGTAAAGAMP